MSELFLTISSDEIGRPVLDEPNRVLSGTELADRLKQFLRDKQPWLAARVRIEVQGEQVVVRAVDVGGGRRGTQPMEILRAFEGTVGMSDKLPEVSEVDSLPEVEMEAGAFDFDPPQPTPEPPGNETLEGLCSKVRYFPVPEAAWYEICDGTLRLTEDALDFEADYHVDYTEDETRDHRVPLASVQKALRDTWCRIPCLRIETREAAYRYGWPARRKEVDSIFTVGEWLTALQKVIH
jgi:hypothetical protein